MIKVSHLLYKVDDLEKMISEFKNKGFKVEYGSKHKPHNALIYFSKGPYIELLERAPLSPFKKILLRLINKNKVLERLISWERATPGFFEICFENNGSNFFYEKKKLDKYGHNYFITKSKRRDPLDRKLLWKLLFPLDNNLPFFMTSFNINPKPKNFIHPNGVKNISRVQYYIDEHYRPLIKELCNDPILDLEGNRGKIDVFFEKE